MQQDRVGELACQLEVDGEGDQTLLSAVMQVALDPPAEGVGGPNHARSRRAELLDLKTQLLERASSSGRAEASSMVATSVCPYAESCR